MLQTSVYVTNGQQPVSPYLLESVYLSLASMQLTIVQWDSQIKQYTACSDKIIEDRTLRVASTKDERLSDKCVTVEMILVRW